MKMVEKEIFVCFFLLFFCLFLFNFTSNQTEEEEGFRYYCFIVSSFPNENDDDDDTTDFESF